MIRLAVRMAVSGGRESAVRLLLTALGIAIGTTMLLLAAAADPAIRAQQRHTAWQFSTSGSEPTSDDRSGPDDALLWHLTHDGVDGQTITVLRVAPAGPGAPVPLGLDHVPRPGEVFASPGLIGLIGELPAEQLGARYPSAPTGTIADRYLAGPDDLVAVIGMPAETLRELEAQVVERIRTEPAPYQFSDFLRLVLAVGAVGLLMPVVVFVSTSTRIGAARREQRFAAMRLAGATPRQTNVLAAVEAAAAAIVGAALGAVGYASLRPHVAKIELDGHASFVDDVRVVPLALVAILVAIVGLAVLAAMVSIRRLQISPLGVARRTSKPAPTARRLLPFAVGTIGFVVSFRFAIGSSGVAMLLPVMATFGLMIYGIVAAGPWITVLTARAIGHIGQRAAVLLAARRLEDDPTAGFRAVSGLVLAVFVASVFSGVTPAVLAEAGSRDASLVAPTSLVVALPNETATSAAATAVDAAVRAGATSGTIIRVDPDPDRPRLDPSTGRATTLVAACDEVVALVPTLRSRCASDVAWIDLSTDAPTVIPAPYSLAELRTMRAQLLVFTTDGSTTTTNRVRTSVLRSLPGSEARLGSEDEAASNRQLIQLNRLTNLALAVTIAIAGCSLAVAVAAGIIERKRPFSLLRLSGMQLRELQHTALLEAAAPLLLIAAASALLGLATSALIVAMAGGIPWRLPTIGYWLGLGSGVSLALGVAAAVLPLLDRVTAPSAVRFE